MISMEGKRRGGLAKGEICEMWRDSGGLPVGGKPHWCPCSAALSHCLPGWNNAPPLLHAFHWLFLPPLVLWSKQDLTITAILAFCGLFLGKSLSKVIGCYGMSSQAFFSSGPLPSGFNLQIAPCTTPRLLLVSQQLPEDEWKGRAIRERIRTWAALVPLLRTLKGLQQISGVERKFFVIISSPFLLGSMNFPEGNGQNFMETKWYVIWEK